MSRTETWWHQTKETGGVAHSAKIERYVDGRWCVALREGARPTQHLAFRTRADAWQWLERQGFRTAEVRS